METYAVTPEYIAFAEDNELAYEHPEDVNNRLKLFFGGVEYANPSDVVVGVGNCKVIIDENRFEGHRKIKILSLTSVYIRMEYR